MWFEVNEENCLPVWVLAVVAEVLQPLDEFPAESPVEFLQGVVAGYCSLAYFGDYVGECAFHVFSLAFFATA